MEDDEDTLVRRRPRRSTAGNRMEAALAELALQNLEPEPEDDADFAGPDDEAEVFDSDFESTDEEAAQEDEAVGEKQIVEEEKQTKRVLRQRVARFEGRQRQAGPKDPPRPRVQKGRRRVSLGAAVDVETGEAFAPGLKRKSRRQSTMLSSQITHTRMRNAEERKASMPKKVKEVVYNYTQAELISRALDTEEGNILEHRNYLSEEEEKRKRAKVVRKVISGPVLRYISRIGEDQISLERPTPLQTHRAGVFQNVHDPSAGFAQGISGSVHSQSAAETTRTEKVTKNYLVHELDQREDIPKPRWEETMSAVFGNHVKWDEIKVYSSRHRPFARPVTFCPITGRRAIYRDPRSGVPFANVGAFKTITHVLSHDYVWNERLSCYVADAEQAAQQPVEEVR